MLKSCFDCDSDAIITDVIYKATGFGLILYGTGALIARRGYDKIVEYTCRQCGAKWYVTVGNFTVIEEIVNYEIR